MERNYKFKVKSIKTMDKELCKFMKVCKECGKLKLVSCFSKRKDVKDGYRNKCKKCENFKRKSRYKHKCLTCNKEFSSPKKLQKFCSFECRDNYKKPYYLNGIKCICMTNIRICKNCGKIKPINKFNENRNICMKCRREANKNIIAKCDYCGREYKSKKCDCNSSKHHFCSVYCKNKWQSENVRGKNHPNWNNHTLKGKYVKENSPLWIPRKKVICPNCGLEFEVEECQFNRTVNNFCSTACSHMYYRGEKHPVWRHDLTQEDRERKRNYTEYRQWVKNVFERDNWTCQLTGQVGGNLEVHHLDCYADFKDKRTDINNGITLSKEVHRLFHKIYGKKHNTKEQFEEFKNRYRTGEFKEVV